MEQNITICPDDEYVEEQLAAVKYKYGTVSKEDVLKWKAWMQSNHPYWLQFHDKSVPITLHTRFLTFPSGKLTL